MRHLHDPIRLLAFALTSGDGEFADDLIGAMRHDRVLARRADGALRARSRAPAVPSRLAWNTYRALSAALGLEGGPQ